MAEGVNRRGFLKSLGAGALTYLLRQPIALAAATATAPTQPTTRPAGRLERSDVYLIVHDRILEYGTVNHLAMRNVLELSIIKAARATSIKAALQTLFSPRDVIGFKFDPAVDYLLKTNQAWAEELVRLFLENGFQNDQIVLLGVKVEDETLPPTRKAEFGWTDPVDFSSGKDQLAGVLNDLTALVNVATLRADAVSDIYGCLRNVTYGFLRHPNQYFANGCSPFVADIYQLPQIGRKVRLNFMNALRVMIRRDRQDRPDAVVNQNRLVCSLDPVALDAVSFQMLDELRSRIGLEPLVKDRALPLHILTAAARELGKAHPDQINLHAEHLR